jgi:hypothetical protein
MGYACGRPHAKPPLGRSGATTAPDAQVAMGGGCRPWAEQSGGWPGARALRHESTESLLQFLPIVSLHAHGVHIDPRLRLGLQAFEAGLDGPGEE